MKLGFAGAGNMAAAMARGWAVGDPAPRAMAFCDLDRDRARALADEVGGAEVASLAELRDGCDVLVLAVKPAALDDVASELGGRAPALLSILAATPLERIAAAFPGVPALRVMPNQPVSVGRGVLCYVSPDESLPEPLAVGLVELLSGLGTPVAVAEELIDAAMAVMSCSPAYVAELAGALAEAGVAEGLDPELAARLVAGAIGGTAELLAAQSPEQIRRAVAPPGGATEAGLDALARQGFEQAVKAAVGASLEQFR